MLNNYKHYNIQKSKNFIKNALRHLLDRLKNQLRPVLYVIYLVKKDAINQKAKQANKQGRHKTEGKAWPRISKKTFFTKATKILQNYFVAKFTRKQLLPINVEYLLWKFDK